MKSVLDKETLLVTKALNPEALLIWMVLFLKCIVYFLSLLHEMY